ncbi:MAG: undecaprenyl-diphosphate phosphatase, partial [Pyrinomonadaceae bacterium]
MNLLQAIILGIVQGLTEFIPVSSTAHLVFASRWLQLYRDNPQQAEQTTATIAVIQLGTLLAVLIYFAPDIFSIAAAFVRDHWRVITRRRGMRFSGTGGVRPIWLSDEAWLGWLIILGSIPVGTIGLLLKKQIEGEATKNLWVIATMMIVIALMLAFAEFVGKQRKDLKNFGIFDALAQGFCQILALIPGSSRAGSTIMGGLLAGGKREAAARFSFLRSISSVLASGLLELKEALKILDTNSLTQLLVGTIVSAIVGYLSIWFLLRYLRTHSTAVFIIYRIIVGGIILGLL